MEAEKEPMPFTELLPTLLSLAGIAIPDSIEGEDLSRLITNNKTNVDRAALVMSVSPFAGYHGGRAFRGIRTARCTYVRNTDGPWLLYENETDPYQMKNLVGVAAHADLEKELEGKLQAKLKETGDRFLPGEQYLKEWGYQVDKRGCIPYDKGHKVQSPAGKPGKKWSTP